MATVARTARIVINICSCSVNMFDLSSWPGSLHCIISSYEDRFVHDLSLRLLEPWRSGVGNCPIACVHAVIAHACIIYAGLSISAVKRGIQSCALMCMLALLFFEHCLGLEITHLQQV